MTAIEWTDKVWNPTTGCDRVSPGCDNCYALAMAKRLKGMGQAKYQRDGDPRTSGPGFGLAVHPDTLAAPLHWRKPRRVFVNSMSDLFHKDVPDEFIASVWEVMGATPQHTYQILTKRPQRMRALLTAWTGARRGEWGEDGCSPPCDAADRRAAWPLPNVWLGTSVESQKWADIRIPHLLETPAAVRFLSCEPLLGPVDLSQWLGVEYMDALGPPGSDEGGWGAEMFASLNGRLGGGIGWVIVGGESGPGARPMHPDWARTLRDQCTAAGVPYFFKQWGEHIPVADSAPQVIVPEYGIDGDGPFTRGAGMRRVGKKAAGRELDGRTWDEYPATAVPA